MIYKEQYYCISSQKSLCHPYPMYHVMLSYCSFIQDKKTGDHSRPSLSVWYPQLWYKSSKTYLFFCSRSPSPLPLLWMRSCYLMPRLSQCLLISLLSFSSAHYSPWGSSTVHKWSWHSLALQVQCIFIGWHIGPFLICPTHQFCLLTCCFFLTLYTPET